MICFLHFYLKNLKILFLYINIKKNIIGKLIYFWIFQQKTKEQIRLSYDKM